MGEQKRSPYAECHGELYVTGAVHFLCLSVDGIPVSLFGKDPRPFITVPQAIKWHEDEMAESHGRSGSVEAIKVMKDVYAVFLKEKAAGIHPKELGLRSEEESKDAST